MRRYIVTLFVIAFLVGTLFKAADQTGVPLMKMFGTLGIFLFGVIGTLALVRWQSQESRQEITVALKQLEPKGFFITDWSAVNDGRPNYLVVGSGGLAAICTESLSASVKAGPAADRIARGRERSQAAVRWLRDRLNQGRSELREPLGDLVRELPVASILLLTRRKANQADSAEDVIALNPDQLSAYLLAKCTIPLLDEGARITLTRLFRKH